MSYHPPLTDEQQVAVDWCLAQAGANPDQFLAELANRLHLSAAQKHRLALVLARGPSFEVMHVLGGEIEEVRTDRYNLSLQVSCASTLYRLDVVGCPFTTVLQVTARGSRVPCLCLPMPGDAESAQVTIEGGLRLQAGETVHVHLVVTGADLPFVRLPVRLRGVLEVARGPAGEVIDSTFEPGVFGAPR